MKRLIPALLFLFTLPALSELEVGLNADVQHADGLLFAQGTYRTNNLFATGLLNVGDPNSSHSTTCTQSYRYESVCTTSRISRDGPDWGLGGGLTFNPMTSISVDVGALYLEDQTRYNREWNVYVGAGWELIKNFKLTYAHISNARRGDDGLNLIGGSYSF